MTDLHDRAESVLSKVAASSVLWKYADPDGKEFYLLKKLTPVRSPYTGKSFTVKPERLSLSDVGKELKSDAKAEKKASVEDFWKEAFMADPEPSIDFHTEFPISVLKLGAGKTLPGSLWEYSDEDGNKFYLPKKQTGALHSPFTGKTFTGKPTKNTLSDVGKDLKEMSKKADDQQEPAQEEQQKEASWKVDPAFAVLAQEQEQQKPEETQQKTACGPGGCQCGGQCGGGGGGGGAPPGGSGEASLILEQGESHPALKVLLAAYNDVVKAVASAKGMSDAVTASTVGEDVTASVVLLKVKPAVQNLARVAAIVAKQMETKIK